MSTALVTGSAGLIGSEASRYFHAGGRRVVGIDNDMRAKLFGGEASTAWIAEDLSRSLSRYRHESLDIRDAEAVDGLLAELGTSVDLIIHTAAQPSHDWAAQDPMTDFSINAKGTLVLLEAVRRHAPQATFIFTSTNKVYGDTPNRLPFVEEETRWELPEDHEWYGGIPETMSIDHTKHSLFGVSKVAADLLVQEYARYFGLNTVVFRAGCLTGPAHAGAELHGFLAYLMKCVVTGTPYTVYGYKAKQVRDNIHGADLVRAFDLVSEAPRRGAVYNIGGGRCSNCSMLEAIGLCQEIAGRKLTWTYDEEHRIGDHIWWISDLSSFRADYPGWKLDYALEDILREIFEANVGRWSAEHARTGGG